MISLSIDRIKIISLIGVMALFGCDCVAVGRFPGVEQVALDVLVGLFLLVLAPEPHEKQELPLYSVLFFSFSMVSAFVLSFISFKIKLAVLPLLMIIFSLVDLKVRSENKFSRINNLFRCVEVWNNLEDYSHMMKMIVFTCLIALLEIASSMDSVIMSGVIIWVDVIFSAGILIFWMVTEYSTSIFGKNLVSKVKAAVDGEFSTVRSPDLSIKESKMADLYERTQKVMVRDKPYLDETFKLEDLAHMLYTNKSYLSRTINTMSGRNFNQYINYFRVENAVELMAADNRMKLSEIALLSGFHNMVSFNSAFFLFKGTSPGEWQDHLRSRSFK